MMRWRSWRNCWCKRGIGQNDSIDEIDPGRVGEASDEIDQCPINRMGESLHAGLKRYGLIYL